MKQPKKVDRTINSKTKTKKKKIVKQPIPKDISFWVLEKDYKIPKDKDKRKEPGVSNLEVLFEEMFLKKLKVKYVYQWQAPTGRFYDFYLPEDNILIECDGTFYHSDPRFYDRNNLIYENQKRQVRIDEEKNKWAFLNGFVLLRFWEHDIKTNSKEVLKALKKQISKKSKKL